MGDRGQVCSSYGKNRIFLYTHWGGTFLGGIVQQVLQRKVRWKDEEYLARIIFDAMTKDCVDTETGFGIGCQAHGDIEHPILELDTSLQKVKVWNSSFTKIIKTMSFEEFCTYVDIQNLGLWSGILCVHLP